MFKRDFMLHLFLKAIKIFILEDKANILYNIPFTF